jgi:hypothetical protein
MWTPEAFAQLMLLLNPDSWAGRRPDAYQALEEWYSAADGRTVPESLPAWVNEGLPKTFPPEL